jgi:hypothetical protein
VSRRTGRRSMRRKPGSDHRSRGPGVEVQHEALRTVWPSAAQPVACLDPRALLRGLQVGVRRSVRRVMVLDGTTVVLGVLVIACLSLLFLI